MKQKRKEEKGKGRKKRGRIRTEVEDSATVEGEGNRRAAAVRGGENIGVYLRSDRLHIGPHGDLLREAHHG